jgi:hypothetical protein
VPEHEAGDVPAHVRDVPGRARVPVPHPGGLPGRDAPPAAVSTRGTDRSARPVRDGSAVALPGPVPSDCTP